MLMGIALLLARAACWSYNLLYHYQYLPEHPVWNLRHVITLETSCLIKKSIREGLEET